MTTPTSEARVSDELAEAKREALYLAKTLHRLHYPEVTQWKPLDDVAGIISQIDNMVAGLVKPSSIPSPKGEAVAWRGDNLETLTIKFTAKARVAEIWEEQGLSVVPLYTAPTPEQSPALATDTASAKVDGVVDDAIVERAARAIAGADFDGVLLTTRTREQYVEAYWRLHETDARAALSAISHSKPAVGDVGEWLPIETAPKDGSWISAYFPSYVHDQVRPAHFIKDPGLGSDIWEMADGYEYADGAEAPTHWQPLPPPPTAIEGNGL